MEDPAPATLTNNEWHNTTVYGYSIIRISELRVTIICLSKYIGTLIPPRPPLKRPLEDLNVVIDGATLLCRVIFEQRTLMVPTCLPSILADINKHGELKTLVLVPNVCSKL